MLRKALIVDFESFGLEKWINFEYYGAGRWLREPRNNQDFGCN